MRIALFGATGATGRRLMEQGLAAGHEVTAFVRDPARVTTRHDRLKIVQGDVRDPEAVEAAIIGQDAVISALGQTRSRPSTKDVMTVAAEHIVAAMRKHGVRRLVTLVGAGVAFPQDRPSRPGQVMSALLKLLAGDVLADAERDAQIIQASDLDWVIVRVPRLSEAPAKGAYRTGYQRPGFGAISRDDVADFMLKQVTDDTYLREAPIVSH